MLKPEDRLSAFEWRHNRRRCESSSFGEIIEKVVSFCDFFCILVAEKSHFILKNGDAVPDFGYVR